MIVQYIVMIASETWRVLFTAELPRPTPVKNVMFRFASWIRDEINPTNNGEFNLTGNWVSDIGKFIQFSYAIYVRSGGSANLYSLNGLL